MVLLFGLCLAAYSTNLIFNGTNDKGYKEYENKKDGSILIEVPAGEFWMGSPPKEGDDDEHPQHKVYLDTFYISKYEVKNEQFDRFVRATGYKTDAEKIGKARVYIQETSTWADEKGVSWRFYYSKDKAKFPVVLISWNDAKAYCDWAGLRLPTEAEWEKASRGNDKRKYPWGNEGPGAKGTARCNYADKNTHNSWSDPEVDDGYKFLAPVGSFEIGRSPFGVYDMSGNVWEWCLDHYGEFYYRSSPAQNPIGPSGISRVLRGGSWFNGAIDLRCAERNKMGPAYSNSDLGFRTALSVSK